MFPLTHIYCTKRIVKDATPLMLYGSIFPDIPMMGIISWDKMKDQTEGFSDYIKKSYPDLIDFSKGLLLHEEPKGIDRFVHGDTGYAYVKGRQILEQIKGYFPDNSLGIAHNFIELAVEILLAEIIPNLGNELKAVLKFANNNTNQISKATSEFFSLDKDATRNALQEFNNLFLRMDLSSRDKSIQFGGYLVSKLGKINYSSEIIEQLLTKAIDTVKGDYAKFLQDTIIKCKSVQ